MKKRSGGKTSGKAKFLAPAPPRLYWTPHGSALKHCFLCGGRLVERYVKNEKRRRDVCVCCGIINYMNPKVVAGLIPVLPDGRIVLLKRSKAPAQGKWTFPAGYQEMGETVAQAASRESQEEIHLRVKARSLVGIYSYASSGVVTIVFEGPVRRGQTPSPGDEASAVKAVPVDEIPWGRLAFRSTIQALRDWEKGIGAR